MAALHSDRLRQVPLYWKRLKIAYKHSENVGTAQEGQKQGGGGSCGEVFAVCGFQNENREFRSAIVSQRDRFACL